MADSTLAALGAVAVLNDADLLYVDDGPAVDGSCLASVLKTYVSASPTLVTPNLGVATLGGALDGGGYDLNNLGVIFMTEQAAAEANVAGKGQMWVLLATPNLLKFDDDVGTTFGVLTDAGNVPLTANWDVGPYTIQGTQFISDIVTGTAPFVVASTTVVANLNADQVDGKEATDLVLVDGTQPLTANWDVGAYTITGTQFISDIAGGTAPLVVTSTTVVPNLNVDQVDGKDSTDFCLLDGTQALTGSWDAGAFDIRSLSSQLDAGSAPGAVAQRFGTDATEGYEIIVVDEIKSALSAISTDLTADIPDGAYLISVQANIETTVTAGGTSVKVGIGPVADPDKYGITSAFAQNLKIDTIPVHAILSGAEDVQINMCETGGGIGDTVAGAGAVRVRIVYALPNSLKDA